MAAKRGPTFIWLPLGFVVIALALWKKDERLVFSKDGTKAALIVLLAGVCGLWVSRLLARAVGDGELNSLRKVLIAFVAFFADSVGLVCLISQGLFGRESFIRLATRGIVGGLIMALAMACVWTYGRWTESRSREPVIGSIFGLDGPGP